MPPAEETTKNLHVMSQLIRNPDDGVLATLERFVPSERDENGFAMVCVLDHRLLGHDEDRLTIATTVPDMGEQGGPQASRRVLTRYQSERDLLWDRVELLGTWDGGHPISLTLMLSAAGFDAAFLAPRIASLRSRFAAIRLVLVVDASHNDLARAATEQWLREQGIALAAAGVAKPFVVERRTRDGVLPSAAIGAATFSTGLGQVLRLAAGTDPHSSNEILVARTDLTPVRDAEIAVPFLSVVTRTHGKRFHTLKDVFCCLSAQECTDFEHLIVAHNLNTGAEVQLAELIDAQMPEYRARIRVVTVRGGNRTRPINAGFEAARGHYVAILDDDDIVFANWVEAFRDQALRTPGRLLRAASVRQECEEVTINGMRSTRAVSGMHDEYGRRYDHLRQLIGNLTPPVSVAFPRYVFAELEQRFDETLTTTEDWEYIVRCTALVGAGSIEDITSIYRWWNKAYSSRTDHNQSEWDENHARILARLCEHPYIFSCDTIEETRTRHEELKSNERWAFYLKSEIDRREGESRERDGELDRLRDELNRRDNEEREREVELERRDAESLERDGELDRLRDEVDALKQRLVLTEKDRTYAEEQIIRAVGPIKDGIAKIQISPIKVFGRTAEKHRRRVKMRAEFVAKSGLFDPAWYIQTYPDVAQDNMPPLEHFVLHGSRELRSPGPEFDARFYYFTYEDVRASRIEPLFHYVRYGRTEGRRATP